MLSSVVSPAVQYFYTLSRKDMIFERKNILEHKICAFIFSIKFIWKISHFKKNWERYNHKCVLVFRYIIRFSCPILIPVKYSGQISDKYIKSYENPSSGSRVIPCTRTDGNTDGHTDRHAKSIVAFRNFANVPKIIWVTSFLKACSFSPTQQIFRLFLTRRCSYITAAQQWAIFEAR